MKKISVVVMAIVLVVSALWFHVDQANAAGTIVYRGGVFVWGKGVAFAFDASGYRNRDIKNARIFAGSNFHDLYCTVDKEADKIVCVAGGGLTQFAGQTGVIYLAGQVFYVTIPDRSLRSSSTAGCGSGEVFGAMVTFDAAEGDPQSYFLAGQTLSEVGNSANDLMGMSDGFFTNPKISSIDCGVPTLPGFLE